MAAVTSYENALLAAKAIGVRAMNQKPDIQTKTQYTFFACRFCFPNTDHVKIPRRVLSFKVGQFHVRTQSI